jgi:methyl-CpG-binding domain protein 4
MSWIPPKSPYGLIQRQFYDDPWRLLVSCVFCNLTKRVVAEPIMWQFFERWPTPEEAAEADESEIAELLKKLGLHRRRARTLKVMSQQFIDGNWLEPDELYGIGKYANDAYHIFCIGDWWNVMPKDHALSWYHEWLTENLSNE